MSSWPNDIADMHEKFGVTKWVNEASFHKQSELLKLRMRMLLEEFQEIADYVKDYINKHRIYKSSKLTDIHVWGQLYNEGDHQTSHSHVPYTYSWTYYVKAPKGSSPIVFKDSDYKLHPKESDLIIFPSWVWHHVPKNKCKGRAIVAGNLGDRGL